MVNLTSAATVYKDVAHFYPLRKNRCVRSDFCGSTVQVASSGDPVSFYTTEGGVVFQFVKGNRVEMSHGIWRGA